jgi:hypothetical protein
MLPTAAMLRRFSLIGEIMFYKEITALIGTREDVENILMELNDFLLQNVDQAFCIGEGLDGPTATWSRRFGGDNLPLMLFMQEVAAMLRRKLDIAAHVVP